VPLFSTVCVWLKIKLVAFVGLGVMGGGREQEVWDRIAAKPPQKRPKIGPEKAGLGPAR